MKITFRCPPELEGHIPAPQPAKRSLPDWLRQMPGTAFAEGLGMELLTVKRCPPFIDAMTRGFTLSLAADVTVKGGIFSWDWDLPVSSIEGYTRAPITFHQSEQASGTPLFDAEQMVLKFNNFWTIETPKDVLLLATHPINRPELPFLTLTGLVDTHAYSHGLIHFPAIWKDKDFEGVLAKGTPIVQCVPVPREELTLEIGLLEDEHAEKHRTVAETLQQQSGYYRSLVRGVDLDELS